MSLAGRRLYGALVAATATIGFAVWAADPPKNQVATLEDFYGATGVRFQGAFGFRTFERTPNSPEEPNSYGVAVDDMVISWKETRLDPDVHDCVTGGECADIEVTSTVSYDSTSLVEVTVIDKSPYDAVNSKNDPNGDW
jgi:hypothetical protein